MGHDLYTCSIMSYGNLNETLCQGNLWQSHMINLPWMHLCLHVHEVFLHLLFMSLHWYAEPWFWYLIDIDWLPILLIYFHIDFNLECWINFLCLEWHWPQECLWFDHIAWGIMSLCLSNVDNLYSIASWMSFWFCCNILCSRLSLTVPSSW